MRLHWRAWKAWRLTHERLKRDDECPSVRKTARTYLSDADGVQPGWPEGNIGPRLRIVGVDDSNSQCSPKKRYDRRASVPGF